MNILKISTSQSRGLVLSKKILKNKIAFDANIRNGHLLEFGW